MFKILIFRNKISKFFMKVIKLQSKLTFYTKNVFFKNKNFKKPETSAVIFSEAVGDVVVAIDEWVEAVQGAEVDGAGEVNLTPTGNVSTSGDTGALV